MSSSKFRLTKNQLETITQEVIRQLDAEQKKRQKQEKDWRLRNTKLLLENYRRLREHCDDIDQQLEEYEHTIFVLEELTLESLMKYKIKTAKMMRHFDRMLNHFRTDSLNGTEEEQRRYKIIYHRYLSAERISIPKLCEAFGVEQGTVYRDTNIAINNISILLFGLVSLDTTGFKAH